MKRNGLFVLVLALAAVLCTGCGVKDEDLKSDPLVNADGTAPVGSTLVAPAPQDDFVLLDNKDILSANGLYYASWVNGDAQPYENSEGKTVDLYDAQLTLVVQENKTEDKAASAVEGWQTLAQQNYDISDTQTLTAAGQEYTVIQSPIRMKAIRMRPALRPSPSAAPVPSSGSFPVRRATPAMHWLY